VAGTSGAYANVAGQSPDGVLACRQGRVVYTNPVAVRLLKIATASELLDRPVLDLFTPSTRPLVVPRVSLEGGPHPPERLDVRLTPFDGSVCDVELATAWIAEETLVQMTLRDVTDRLAAERVLRENEERLRLAFAGAQEGVWDWDLETGAVLYSERWKAMLGYACHEVEPHVSAWERLLHPDDSIAALAAVHGLSHGEDTYRVECRLRHKDGHYVHVLSRGFPVRGSGGRVVRIVGTHLDLTERLQAETALRESEERLTLAFAGAQEGVWDWNLETGAVVYSPRWKQMLGYAEDEIEPHVSAWERLLHPDDRPRADQVNRGVVGGHSAYEAEFRLRHKDGHYVHVLSRGLPVRRGPNGPVVRIVGTHLDLTERKAAEDALRRAHEELEHRVQQRTAELARANLSLQNEMQERERAERARTELLGRLVFAQEDERRRIAREMHDQFGEHLTALARGIGVLTDGVQGQAGLEEQVRALDAVAQRLDRDVDHLVWELRPTALDDLGLRAALSNYVKGWSARVNIAAQVHTSGLLDDRLPSDVETTLYRIAQEALTNVAKHSHATNVEIILERRPDAVVLIVEDNGVGFNAGAGHRDGHGFGLLGMQERATLVGATLEIESAADQGTTVLVRMTAATLSAAPRG
jgi:PAS domain S-box-containing protein